MGVTANTGPLLTFGQTLTSTGGVAEYNESIGPSLLYQGVGITDPRTFYAYQPGQGSSTPIYGWYGIDRILAVDQVPTTAAENSIAATQSATTTTTRTLTLNTTNGTNTTVGVSLVRADTGATVSVMAIDGAASTVTFGSAATVNMWNPQTMIARTVRIEGSSDDSAGAFTVNGYDVYGYPMTETVTGSISTTAGSTFVATRKAFKYIASITASGTVNSTGVTVGVTDTYGFPLAVSDGNKVLIGISSGTSFNTVTTSTGITPASTVATQTSTTPDVRGTWSSTTAADGTRRYTITITPNPVSLGSTGLFGATQA